MYVDSFRIKSFSAFLVLLLSAGLAFASDHVVRAVGSGSDSSSLTVACANGRISFSVQWGSYIGAPGKYRRHLFLPDMFGDVHILMPVLPSKLATGIVKSDLQAKELVQRIVESGNADTVFVEVFPEGADPVNGEWLSRQFVRSDILRAANAAALECGWNRRALIKGQVRSVAPGVPYSGD